MKIIIHVDEEGQTIDDVVHDVFVESVGVVRLQHENERLAIDSVALDKIIDVVEAWDHGLERSPDVRMKEIAKIIEERGD